MVLHTPKDVSKDPSAEVPVNRKVLLAMDSSKASEEALDWTVANMYHPGDSLHILHVVPAMPLRQEGCRGGDSLVCVVC